MVCDGLMEITVGQLCVKQRGTDVCSVVREHVPDISV
jgi:hypothetical protein